VNTQSTWPMAIMVTSMLFVGCQGTGQTINFDPHALTFASTKTEAIQEDNLIIVVEPFRDIRPQQQRIGTRTHFWGGTTHFNAWNGKVSEGIANLAIEYLQQRKWRASGSEPVADGANTPIDVILTGDVLSLEANVKSGFGFTDIAVTMKVRFEAKNTVDGSTIRMVLGANGTDSVAVFDPKDVEQLTNLVAKDLFRQLFQDLTVKNRAFHLQSDHA